MNKVNKKGKILESVNRLIDVLEGALEPGKVILIEGAPGAGKTTLSLMISFYMALNLDRVLYFSFYEDKETLYNNAKRLGINLREFERRGLFKYMTLKFGTSLEKIMDKIRGQVINFMPRLIVIDSVNPILMLAENDVSKRALVQNYFVSMARSMKMNLILLAEVNSDSEPLTRDIEYIVDAVVALKYRADRKGLIERVMEIRKARGAKHHMGKIPFSIKEESGLEIYAPIAMSEIPSLDLNVKYELPCRVLKDYAKHLYKGQVVYMGYSSFSRPAGMVLIPIGFLVLNKLKSIVISFRLSPTDLELIVKSVLTDSGVNNTLAEFVTSMYIKFYSINVLSSSLVEIVDKVLDLIDSEQPDLVILHGVEVLDLFYQGPELLEIIESMLFRIKEKKVTSIMMGALDFGMTRKLAELHADLTLEFKFEENGYMKLLVSKRGRDPIIVDSDGIEECSSEVKELIKSRLPSNT